MQHHLRPQPPMTPPLAGARRSHGDEIIATGNCSACERSHWTQPAGSRVGRPIIPNSLQFLFPKLIRVGIDVLPKFPGDFEEPVARHPIPVLQSSTLRKVWASAFTGSGCSPRPTGALQAVAA